MPLSIAGFNYVAYDGLLPLSLKAVYAACAADSGLNTFATTSDRVNQAGMSLLADMRTRCQSI